MDDVVFSVKRYTVGVRLVLGLLILALGGWFLVSRWEVDPRLALTLGVLIAVSTMSGLIRLLFESHGLIINRSGITDHTAQLGFIPWWNISGVRRRRFAGLSTIVLELTDFHAFLEGLGPVQRLIWRQARWGQDLQPRIIASFLLQGHTVGDVIEQHLPKTAGARDRGIREFGEPATNSGSHVTRTRALRVVWPLLGVVIVWVIWLGVGRHAEGNHGYIGLTLLGLGLAFFVMDFDVYRNWHKASGLERIRAGGSLVIMALMFAAAGVYFLLALVR